MVLFHVHTLCVDAGVCAGVCVTSETVGRVCVNEYIDVGT